MSGRKLVDPTTYNASFMALLLILLDHAQINKFKKEN